MKVIDLLNKMANGEKLPKKILIKDKVYYLINDADGNIVYSQAKDKSNWGAFIDHKLNITRCLNEEALILDTGVEISEENTIDIESIEELATGYSESGADTDIIKYINDKIVPSIKQLNKEIKSRKEK